MTSACGDLEDYLVFKLLDSGWRIYVGLIKAFEQVVGKIILSLFRLILESRVEHGGVDCQVKAELAVSRLTPGEHVALLGEYQRVLLSARHLGYNVWHGAHLGNRWQVDHLWLKGNVGLVNF